jgi:hypothetical protein
MTENIDQFGNDMAQLKALMQVIDEISKSPIPLVDTADVVTNRNIRNLEKWAMEYVMDDGDLVHDLKSAIIEIKYLASIVKDLRGRLAEQDTRIENLEADGQMLADRLRHAN